MARAYSTIVVLVKIVQLVLSHIAEKLTLADLIVTKFENSGGACK